MQVTARMPQSGLELVMQSVVQFVPFPTFSLILVCLGGQGNRRIWRITCAWCSAVAVLLEVSVVASNVQSVVAPTPAPPPGPSPVNNEPSAAAGSQAAAALLAVLLGGLMW